MIADSAIYVDGRREAAPDSLHGIYEACRKQRGLAWVHMRWIDPGKLKTKPEKQEVERLNAEEFASVIREFEPYTRELADANKSHQRPNVERYNDLTFAVLATARYMDDEEAVKLGELRIFAGPDFVVTVALDEIDTLRQVRQRLEAEPEMLRRDPMEILYAIMEQVVKDYFPVVEGLQRDIDQIERQVFAGESGVSRRIYQLFREVIQFQRVTKPLVGVLDNVGEDSEIDPVTKRRIRASHNRVLRVTEEVSDYRELLTNILSVNQNEQMKKISAWAAIVIVPALVAGIYGMNFEFMPELHWRYGYLLALFLMALIAFGLYTRFKKSDWL